MIEHWIGKPKVQWSPNGTVQAKKITQDELNEILKASPFKEGVVVCSDYFNHHLQFPGQCDIIVEVITDVNKIDYSYYDGAPRFLKVMSCYVDNMRNVTPYVRFDNGTRLKIITAEDYERVITPIYDQLQDRVKQAKQTSESSN